MKFVKERVATYKAIREVEFRKELLLRLVGKVLEERNQKDGSRPRLGTIRSLEATLLTRKNGG